MRVSLLVAASLACGVLTGTAGCRSHAGPDKDAIVGRWLLGGAGGKSLRELSIASYRLHFGAHGDFTYEVHMTGTFAGSDFEGQGSYRLEGDRLHWSAAAHQGDSRVRLAGDELTLDPDPILAPDGATPVTSNYHRE